MRKVVLDTSFILSCIRQKIDFFEILKLEGMQILIPEKVLKELKALKADLALAVLKNNKFKKINLKGKNADRAIINYANQNSGILIATLDKEIKKETKNPKIIIRQKKTLEFV